MEDRKRPQMADRDDLAPPPKRQATQVNGTKADLDPLTDRDRVIEEFTKDAIIRQKNEYKRQKQDLEEQLADAKNKMKYHDDHLRVHDLWFSQLVDEIRVLANDTLVTAGSQPAVNAPFPTSLLFSDIDNFESHLAERSESIKTSLSDLFARIPASSPEVVELQSKLAEVLATEKKHAAELHQAISEKEQLSTRLQNATERYVLAERKYDRERSKAVAMVGLGSLGAVPVPTAVKEESSSKEKPDTPPATNGSAGHGDTDAAQREARAVAEKRKVQCEQLVAENEKLTKQVTTLNVRVSSLTDDDYAKTDLFKMIKMQYEDVIKRINDKEATNVQLREELQKLQAERTEYRNKVEDESKEAISERESQLARTEQDLTRVRHARDEMASELAIKKASQEDTKVSSDQIKELASARESRIAALETEVERLREMHISETPQDLDGLSEQELRSKITSIRKEYELLSNELPSMETAWKKAQALALKKIAEVTAWEEQVQRLTAEKAKADQKYFAAMKSKDARDSELRVLRNQNGRSSEIIAALKATEKENQSYKIKMEHQLAECKELLNKLTDQNRTLQQKVTEQTSSLESNKYQITELKNALNSKDAIVLSSKQSQRELEVENEKMKVRLEESEKALHNWKDKQHRDQMSELWRQYALCPVCHSNFKNAAIKTCAHVMCYDCIELQIKNRSRKCPVDGKAFGTQDIMKLSM